MKYFDHRQFSLKELVKLKKKANLTIGLGLPVCNEEKTIQRTIETVRKCKDLIDEIIVLDSNSNDATRQICKKLGIKLIADSNSAKELPVNFQRGKGWNLWTSLYYLNTDIILWIDTDIQNIDTRFITGIIGPMLTDNKIKFVKGYYHRPKGDARVTEIMARPFLNLIFPELKNFIQPLSGEYGGKREFLEKIYFYSGYSVEVTLLIQATLNLKPNEIAQVYLDKRIHELQDVPALGKMSASILYTLLQMAFETKRLKTTKMLPTIMTRFTSKDGVKFIPAKINIADKKLPKMTSIAWYKNKFKGK